MREESTIDYRQFSMALVAAVLGLVERMGVPFDEQGEEELDVAARLLTVLDTIAR